MQRIGDHVQIVDEAAAGEALQARRSQLDAAAERLQQEKATLGIGAVVLSSMLRCAATQLQILEVGWSLPLEISAGACRTAFELYVRAKLVEKNPTALRDFYVERVFDEKSLGAAFLRLTGESTQAADLRPIHERISELDQYIARNGLVKPPTASLSQFKLAEEAGLSEEYKSLYNFYSKYTHASSWLVNTKPNDRNGHGYRSILQTMTQVYVGAVEDSVVRTAASIRSAG